MNYLKEINAFYDWLETNSLSTSGIVLWHALMHINNKAGWAEEFGVATSVLSIKTGLADRTIREARNELKQKGRIDWRSRGGNKTAIYKIIPLSACDADTNADSHAGKYADTNADSHAALIKLNKTKRNNNSGSNNGLAEIAAFYENNIGLIAPFIRDEIVELIQKDAVEPAVIIEALKIAVNNNVRNWSYARAIINAAIQENACTLEKFNAWQREHEAKKAEQKIKKNVKQLKRQDTNEWVEEITRMAGIEEVQ